ncbi:replication initiation factor domain-containing protein [Chitinimonas naiadis]
MNSKRLDHGIDQRELASRLGANREATAAACEAEWARIQAAMQPLSIQQACELTRTGLAAAAVSGAQEPADGARAYHAQRGRTGADAGAAAAPTVITGGAETIEPMRLVLSDGKLKEVLVRVPGRGQTAIIDWINVTFHASTCWERLGATTPQNRDMVISLSHKLRSIGGDAWVVTRQCEKGRNFYHEAYEIGDGLGFVCIGGQRDTMLVMLNSQALTTASEGWQAKLYDFLTHVAIQPRLTRVDVAHDDFTGERYTVDRALEDYEAGLFVCHVMQPDCERRGNWHKPNGKGRTAYIGHRANGKYCRVYEKGMQLGSPESPWVRIEVEFKSVDRVIPFEILLNPGEYLAAAYPAFAWIDEHQTRIETYKREANTSYQTMLAWLKRQCGPALAFAEQVEGSASAVLELVRRDDTPRRMKRYVLDVAHETIESLTPVAHSLEELAEMAFPESPRHPSLPADGAMA